MRQQQRKQLLILYLASIKKTLLPRAFDWLLFIGDSQQGIDDLNSETYTWMPPKLSKQMHRILHCSPPETNEAFILHSESPNSNQYLHIHARS